MIPQSNKLADHLHYFLTCYLPQHKEVSPHTISSYKQSFIHLLRYWKSRFPQDSDPDLEQFTVDFLLDFLSDLEQSRHNSCATRNVRLAAVKSFFKMVSLLQPRFHHQARQIRMIPSKRAPRNRFDYLGKNEVDTLFASVNVHNPKGYRDLVILRTLYNTGARASELCALRLSDLNFPQKQLRLYGKGRKSRVVPLWASTVAFLQTYLKSERSRPLSGHEPFLFINQRRTRLTRSGLYLLCSHYLAQARLKTPSLQYKRIHPVHGWRYTTASHLLLAGVDISVIQEWLGHVSINTTCRYKGVSIETKRAALQKFYLFESSQHAHAPEGVDWSLYPDLLAFLEAL
jgi:site-specific recombinase XerD